MKIELDLKFIPAQPSKLIANLAQIIQEFDKKRYSEPNVTVGPMSINQQFELAERIVKTLFE